MTVVEQEKREVEGDVFAEARLPWILSVAGTVGLMASLVLTVEKFALLKDPEYVPSCSIDPVLSCGSIMRTPQAELFGFPNPLLGIVGFTAVVTMGVVLLSGTRLPRWYWAGLQLGTTLGVVFVHWLIYQSLYVIGALCPYCMIVWAVTIPIFWYVTLRNLSSIAMTRTVALKVAAYHGTLITLWFTAIAISVLRAFWTYWLTLV